MTAWPASRIGAPDRSDHPLAADLAHVLEHTAGLWDEVRGQRLFITGGTGFLGSWLLESFVWIQDRLDLQAQALVLTRRPAMFRQRAPWLATHPSVQVVEGDVRTFEFPKGECPYIVHAASAVVSGAAPGDYRVVVDTIVDGTRRVLDFTRGHGGRKLMFVSSGAVYGRQLPSMSHVAEDFAGAPASTDPGAAYGEAKRLGELMCVLEGQRSGFETKIARGFAFVGPYLPIDRFFAVGNFMRDALAGAPVRVRGDGTPRRSYLYAADLAIWMWTILLRGQPARAYNVGSARDLSIADVARLVASLTVPQVPVIVEQTLDPGRTAERYVPDTRRAQRELGLHERIDLREAVGRTLTWYRLAGEARES